MILVNSLSNDQNKEKILKFLDSGLDLSELFSSPRFRKV